MQNSKCFVWIAFMILILTACNGNKNPGTKNEKSEEKVFIVNIVPDSAKLHDYLAYHEKVWPEVEAGFKKAGYQNITIYRYGFLLVMRISVPYGANLDSMGKLAESYSPRCAEWNKLMDSYQQGVPGTAPGQKWVEAKSFYEFRH